jgi:MoaA/NifB/PqqE/SkfB family radical SAM enzyme
MKPVAEFPSYISFTITNRCNLRCRMCGQWSEEGYVRGKQRDLSREMDLVDWERLVDEVADHGVQSVLLRGGEPFLFPGIVELLEHLHQRDLFVSIDTNGTLLKEYAEVLTRLGKIHVTISVDGPEEIHDQVRGVKGTFQRLKEGVARLFELEAQGGQAVSKSVNFTILDTSYRWLPLMPDVTRNLGINTMAIVPYYYFPAEVGRRYESELRSAFACPAFSWVGFHHEESGVDFEQFQSAWRAYRANLGEIYDFPYMAFGEEEYRVWFQDATTPVGRLECANVEKLIDIQPTGEANFCVDFPDYSLGNVKEASIESLWNGERASQFRQYRRHSPLAICYRCGSKYMGEM